MRFLVNSLFFSGETVISAIAMENNSESNAKLVVNE